MSDTMLLSEHEQKRLKALADYFILDTPPSVAFDRLTELATHVFEVPTSLITLIDEKRQWFKSRMNFGAAETPRAVAFCAQTILLDKSMVVRDALRDERFNKNPLVTGAPHIRFYAGAPLRTSAGYNLGTIALLDYRPREFTEQQQHLLELLAGMAVDELELWRRTAVEKREERMASERRFRALIENSADVVVLIDAAGKVVYASPSVRRTLGYEVHEFMALDPFSLLHPDEVVTARQHYVEVASVPGHLTSMSGRIRHRDGTFRHFEASAQNLLHDADVQAIVINSRDVTAREEARAELRRTEAQLQQAQKMEALGQLAGGIAHDFNNVLTVVLASVGSLATMVREVDPACEEVVAIRDAAQHAAKLTRQILAFSRGQALKPVQLDLNQHLEHALKLLARVLGKVEIEYRPTAGLPILSADPTQVEQVIFNLCINARDAMSGDGKLSVRTYAADVDAELAAEHAGAAAGPHVVLQVRDNGVGMKPEVMQRLFEPFFTGKGSTGLGLSSVYGIIQQHGGFITVESTPGQGSTFRVYFPVRPAPRQSEAPTGTIRSGNELILVADDDAAIRRAASRVLRGAGYGVITADDGQHAVELFGQDAPKIALVLLDIRMPRMSGLLALREIRRMNAHVPVLLSSGYVGKEDVAEAAASQAQILEKPYDDAALLSAVRQALGAPELSA